MKMFKIKQLKCLKTSDIKKDYLSKLILQLHTNNLRLSEQA